MFVIFAIVAFLLALALDGAVYRWISIDRSTEGEHSPLWKLEQSQFYQFVRLVGFVPAWLAIAFACDLVLRRRRPSWDRSGVQTRDDWVTPGMVVTIAVTGIGVALLKALIGRERPLIHDGDWFFKPFLRGFTDGSNLSTPSSHAAIAFVGALVISRLRPGTGVIAIPLAIGCAYSRVLVGAHFLSDVVLGAIVAWVVVELFLPKDRFVRDRL